MKREELAQKPVKALNNILFIVTINCISSPFIGSTVEVMTTISFMFLRVALQSESAFPGFLLGLFY